MFTNKKYIVFGLVVIIAFLFLNCAPGNERWDQEVNPGHRAGFWAGIWHGLLIIITFIVSLFTREVGIYEVNNAGWSYNLGFIIGLYLVLGAVFSALAIIVLTVPILFPVITALGFDPIWFGIIIVRMVEIGQITPPMGINVFVLKGVAGDIPLETIFKGIFPFLIADVCHVALLVAVPQLATFLPSLMS